MRDVQNAELTLGARWLFPVGDPPLEHGTITIAGDKITAVEPRGRRRADIDLGNVAVLPGLVNAHTHLDLGGLRGRMTPGNDFTAWLRGVIRHRGGQSDFEVDQAIRAGIAESVAYGTTLMGDISAQGQSWAALAASPLRAVVFHEMLGLPRARARQAWQDARAWLQRQPARATCKPGLSPHAPYSVRASLFRAAASRARRHRFPLAIHLAETPEELQLLREHQGPLVAFLQDLGVYDAAGLVRDTEEILRFHQNTASVLFIHANYLPSTQPIPRGATVVYCPRTHAAFGHEPYPLRQLLSVGVRVALGTDSLASNPDLDVLAEARFVRRHFPDIAGAVLLRMATLVGADALSWHEVTGSLSPGKSADLVVLPLPSQESADPHELILRSDLPVRAVLSRGQWVHGQLAAP
jgi:cytosine/adenosine deaminase-related metal-dependent hydrolase